MALRIDQMCVSKGLFVIMMELTLKIVTVSRLHVRMKVLTGLDSPAWMYRECGWCVWVNEDTKFRHMWSGAVRGIYPLISDIWPRSCVCVCVLQQCSGAAIVSDRLLVLCFVGKLACCVSVRVVQPLFNLSVKHNERGFFMCPQRPLHNIPLPRPLPPRFTLMLLSARSLKY